MLAKWSCAVTDMIVHGDDSDLVNDVIFAIDKKFDQVLETLSALVRLLVPEPKSDELGLKGEQKIAYELCDSTLTIGEIVDEIGKPANQVRKTLVRLREKGLVSSMMKSGNVVYYRVPSCSRRIDDE